MRGAGVLRLGAAMLTATLAACGGAGGAGDGDREPRTDADFVGTYFVVRVGGSTTADATDGATGTLTADGEGGADITATFNDNGAVSLPGTLGLLYDVAADGALAFRTGDAPFETGGLSGDGAVALLAGMSLNGRPRVLLLLRREGTHDLASLSGAYHSAGVVGLGVGALQAFGGPAEFDGGGEGRLSGVTVNSMGTTSLRTVEFSYTVGGDGAGALTIETAECPGGVVGGGAAAIWGGSATPDNSRVLIAVVRAGPADDATFAGEYWAVAFVRELASPRFTSQTGSATADGAGNVTFLLASNQGGVLVPPAAGTATYAVASDGALTLTSARSLRGGISADGRFAVLGGGTTDGSDPAVLFLCRK